MPDLMPDKPKQAGLYSLKELWQVVEYKDGAVYKTKYIRLYWHRIDGQHLLQRGLLSVSLSNDRALAIIENGGTLNIRVR